MDMDYPYVAVRRNAENTHGDAFDVRRAKFRFIGDAMSFARRECELEVNQTLWSVHDQSTDVPTSLHGFLIARWRYEAGKVRQEV